ncbi:hypothetical protein FA13DRAFT_1804459 [Coprinellus micaceus]|uniref:Uncharacterized protein n=1 Tax=Coprinellus micaceus TaxID=71717 RepID=A0A4Y7S7L2_COPMI|nr:hypothetical protein FA13DRAFT_1804459 [Coprinellus micaceus]
MAETTKAKKVRKFCNCWKLCPQGKMVSKSTYHNHAPYRRSQQQAPQIPTAPPSQPTGRSLPFDSSQDGHRDKRQRIGPSPAIEGFQTRTPSPSSPGLAD